MTTYTATYSPDENKLRLSASSRLDAETYERLKTAGFKWAPKQEIFVAPMWTPAREDLLIELAGEIEDDDKSLAERAEERAERFEDYSDKRGKEANGAREYVQKITDHIPLGQPILVGHHSERHARKDAQRIENGMRRAVQLWETSEYWSRRAAGAVAHAKYKERPDVRHRRIKGLEADKRKQERHIQEANQFLELWLDCERVQDPAKQLAMALKIAGCGSHTMPRKEGDAKDWNHLPSAYTVMANSSPHLYAPRTVEEVIAQAKVSHTQEIARATRWLNHYENRIAYERAMLGEGGVVAGEKFDIQAGGRVLIGSQWLVVLRVNKRDGRTLSVRTNARYVPVRGIEEVNDYQAPSAEDAAKVKKATALGPLVNYPTGGGIEMTKAQFEKVPKDYRGTEKIKATQEVEAHRVRCALGCFVNKTGNDRHCYFNVFITDAKRVDPPRITATAKTAQPIAFEKSVELAQIPEVVTAAPAVQIVSPAKAEQQEAKDQFAAMRESLEAGIQVVTASQLFPTPAPLAAQLVDMAEIGEGMRVLEPSAGTGNLLQAIRNATADGTIRTAVEIDLRLCERLSLRDYGVQVHNGDFLKMSADALGRFDRVVMNPPFADAQDIAHIEHAITFMKPGGRIVAICANGPRQNARLGALAQRMGGSFAPLPVGSFSAVGTNVHAAVFVGNAPDA